MFWQEVHKLDQQITLTINSWDSALTDPIWCFFSDIPVWIPMYVAIVGLLFWRLGWKRGLIATLAAIATFGFCDQSSNLIKDLVERVRPLNDEFMISNGLNILEGKSRNFSFFSAHAANAFGLATCTFTCLRMDRRASYRGYAAWMFTWATLVALSRVFVGKHYLGDILAGALIGAAAGAAFAMLARFLIKKSGL